MNEGKNTFLRLAAWLRISGFSGRGKKVGDFSGIDEIRAELNDLEEKVARLKRAKLNRIEEELAEALENDTRL